MGKKLASNGKLSPLLKDKGITDWAALLRFVRGIPYGRNSSRTDFSLLLTEKKGTCSTKHGFLKAVAEENGMEEVKLILCMYKMTEKNTPGIETVLTTNGIDFIPEAHCYLKVRGERVDVTSNASNLQGILPDILEEMEIRPSQVGEFKVAYHKGYIHKWIKRESINRSFNEIWGIREKCIAHLSAQP